MDVDEEPAKESSSDQATVTHPLSKAQRIAMFAAVTLNAGLVWASISLMLPFFALETLRKFPHAGIEGNVWVGLIFAVATYAEFAASPFFALDLHKTGSKLMLVLSSLQISGAIFLFSFVNQIDGWTEFLVLCLLIRVAQGVATSGSFVASVSATIIAYPDSTGLATGIYRASVYTGYALGPVIGGYLYDHGGFAMPFYVGSGLLLANTVALALFVPSCEDKQSETPKELSISLRKLFSIPWVWVISGIIFLGNFKSSFIEIALPIHFKEAFDAPTFYSGSAIFAVGILYCLEAPIVGYFIDRGKVRPRVLEVIGLLLTFVGCELVGPAPFLPIPQSTWGSVLAMTLLGIAEPMWSVSALSDILQTFAENGCDNPVALRGVVSGIYQTCLTLGYGTGPIAGSTAAAYLGFPWATSLLGSTILAWAALFICGALYRHWHARSKASADCKYERLSSHDMDDSNP